MITAAIVGFVFGVVCTFLVSLAVAGAAYSRYDS
jgi:hypothetical protein